MENGVENGALAEVEPVDEVGENQVVSSSDGEGDGDVDGDGEEEGQVLQQQPPPPPQSQPQITNDCDGELEGERALSASDAINTNNPDSGPPPLDRTAAPVVAMLEDNLCDKDVDSDAADDDNDDEAKENYEGFNGTGRTVTLQTLMAANVLQPGQGLMTIEYLGQKFVGDLLSDGKIKSHETETIFLTPSAWAMHCKRIINPEKKSGCGWASVKYKGKKLDAYKNTYLRKCALQKETPLDDGDLDAERKSESPEIVVKRTVFAHNTVANRNIVHDANMLIESVPFSSVGKLQPFLITINSSALLLADFHCHLTVREVCGYLGGTWDMNTHTLSITKTYPCRSTRFDRQRAGEVERDIQKMMIQDQLLLVGWYHSHPKFQAEPTLRDCDSQLDYQIRMRGASDLTYTPCVSLIISPYYDENPTLESVVKCIWIVPPNENRQSMEYGRPMLMQYSVLPDKEIPEEVRSEIQLCVDYYTQYRSEVVKFRHIYNNDVTYNEKLKNTLYPKFPSKQSDKALWNWICAVLDCEQEDDFIPPKTIKIIDNDELEVKEEDKAIALMDMGNDVKMTPPKEELFSESVSALEESARKAEEESTAQAEQKASELKVMSLQEQLCMPSGLNMNPVRMLSPLATPNPTSHPSVLPNLVAPTLPPAAAASQQQLLPPQMPPTAAAPPAIPPVSTTPALSSALSASPRDSPITIQSNSASPAKFEVPVRASPSPAKSDTSSHASTSRTRNSPAPSPGKFSVSDIARNSPSITPNKYEAAAAALVPPAAACLPTANDLMAASLAQLAGQLPPNFLQADIAALFQQQRKDYGSSSLNQLAAAAAKVGGSKQGNAAAAAGLNDPNVAAAVAAYSNSFNMPLPTGGGGGGGGSSNAHNNSKSKSERSSKSSSSSSSSNSSSTSNSYKTKLMKELDELKNDPLKMSELIRSPEYAALLLQQAEALGATTLGTLGFGSDYSYLTGAGLGVPTANTQPSNSSSGKSSKSSSSSSAAAAAAALSADYNNLIQASKLLGYDSYMQQSKQSNDLNAFLQQQMAAVAAASIPPPPQAAPSSSSNSSSSKKQQQQLQQQQHQQQQQQQQQAAAQADYTALLQTYTKLFDPNNQFAAAMASSNKHMAGAHNELSALLSSGVGMSGGGGGGGGSKQKQKQNQNDIQSDMLNQLLQLEKQDSEIKALLYRQNKAAADLDALFATPSGAVVGAGPSGNAMKSGGSSSGAGASGLSSPSSLSNPAAYYNALAQEKMQDYAAFFQQQHGKYGIPDPLSKTTLAANNMFMTPSALFKIQQESLSAMMMKPPKSTTPSSARTRESSASPALERLTPTKSANSGGGGGGGGSSSSNSNSAGKYNFSAVDLAISSVPSNTPSPAPSDGSSSSSHRRPSPDLSRLYGELAPPGALLGSGSGLPKKRMEFASVADLAAPPPAKMPKNSMGDDILNLSHD